jgi:hypothetical protein
MVSKLKILNLTETMTVNRNYRVSLRLTKI